MHSTTSSETFEQKVIRWFDLALTEQEANVVQSVILGTIRTPGKRSLVVTLGRLRRDVLRRIWA